MAEQQSTFYALFEHPFGRESRVALEIMEGKR